MEILKRAKKYVIELLRSELDERLAFHNLDHTMNVTSAVEEIANALNCSSEEKEILTLSALFHDTGFSVRYMGHEKESVRIAADFLSENKYPHQRAQEVQQCIMATCLTHQPQSHLEEILRDADLSHLAASDYCSVAGKLKMEWEAMLSKDLDAPTWKKMNLDFLLNHRFHTKYATENWGPQKLRNIKKFKEYIEAQARSMK